MWLTVHISAGGISNKQGQARRNRDRQSKWDSKLKWSFVINAYLYILETQWNKIQQKHQEHQKFLFPWGCADHHRDARASLQLLTLRGQLVKQQMLIITQFQSVESDISWKWKNHFYSKEKKHRNLETWCILDNQWEFHHGASWNFVLVVKCNALQHSGRPSPLTGGLSLEEVNFRLCGPECVCSFLIFASSVYLICWKSGETKWGWCIQVELSEVKVQWCC